MTIAAPSISTLNYRVKPVRFNRTCFPGAPPSAGYGARGGELVGYVPCVVVSTFHARLQKSADFYICRAVLSYGDEIFHAMPEEAMAYYNSQPARAVPEGIVVRGYEELLHVDDSAILTIPLPVMEEETTPDRNLPVMKGEL